MKWRCATPSTEVAARKSNSAANHSERRVGPGESVLRTRALRHVGDRGEDALPEPLAGRHHVVGAARGPTDAQHGVAFADQLAGHRVEDLVEHRVADLRAS